MFNKKRKAAKKQARLEKRTQMEEQFAAGIAEIMEMEDPAEKLLRLSKLQNGIALYLHADRNGAVSKSEAVTITSALSGAAVVCGVGLFHVVAIPVIMGAFGVNLAVSAAGGSVSDVMRNKRITRKMKAEAEGHWQKMEHLSKQAQDLKEELISTQTEQIFQSPLYGKVLQLPGLSEVFAEATAKWTAQMKADLEKEKAAKRQKPAVSRPKPSLKGYSRLSDPFGLKKK